MDNVYFEDHCLGRHVMLNLNYFVVEAVAICNRRKTVFIMPVFKFPLFSLSWGEGTCLPFLSLNMHLLSSVFLSFSLNRLLAIIVSFLYIFLFKSVSNQETLAVKKCLSL